MNKDRKNRRQVRRKETRDLLRAAGLERGRDGRWWLGRNISVVWRKGTFELRKAGDTSVARFDTAAAVATYCALLGENQ